MVKKRPGKQVLVFLVLHFCLLISSVSGICSKMAGRQETLAGFAFWYGMVLGIMVIYALLWQQILKQIPLTVAYANRPVSLLWGMLWGTVFFREQITWKMLLGAGIIVAGIYLVVTDNE